MKHTFHCMTLGSNLDAAVVSTLENIMWIARNNLSTDQRAIATKMIGDHGVVSVGRPKGVSATHVARWLVGEAELPAHLLTKELHDARDKAMDPHGPIVAVEAAYTEATDYLRSHDIHTRYRRPQVFHMVGTAYVRPMAASKKQRPVRHAPRRQKNKESALAAAS